MSKKNNLVKSVCWLLDYNNYMFDNVLKFFKVVGNFVGKSNFVTYSSLFYFIESSVLLNWLVVKGLINGLVINISIKICLISNFLNQYINFLTTKVEFFIKFLFVKKMIRKLRKLTKNNMIICFVQFVKKIIK